LFAGWWNLSAVEVNSYLTQPNYLAELAKKANEQLETLATIKAMLVDERPLTFEACIQWARLKFQDEFFNKISQLLFSFPEDMTVTFFFKKNPHPFHQI
jgi:ubiquitin-activating enzyme E1